MVCPNCMIQMHQKIDERLSKLTSMGRQLVEHHPLGGGFSESEDYLTWEIKHCPKCGADYLELYRATKMPEEAVNIDEFIKGLWGR